MLGIVLAHRFRLVANQVGDLLVAGAVTLPPCGVGDAQAVQRGAGADQSLRDNEMVQQAYLGEMKA